MSAAAPSPRRIQSWQRLREATEHRALFSVERAYALDGARLVARHRKGDPVWPPRPRQRVRLGLVMCGLVPDLVALLLLAHERGRRAVVITFAELAELAGVSQRTAYNAVREAERIGYLVVRPWFDVLNTPAGAAERTTASGVPLKHWQRASAYIPGPALLAGLARQAQLRGVNARVVEAKAAAGPTERTSCLCCHAKIHYYIVVSSRRICQIPQFCSHRITSGHHRIRCSCQRNPGISNSRD